MKVAIVHDSPEATEILRAALAGAHDVVWTARGGQEAVHGCAKQPPDLVLLQLTPPDLTAAETVQRIAAQGGCAILLVTEREGSDPSKVFDAMHAGAHDFIATPVRGYKAAAPAGAVALLNKIDLLARMTGSAPRPRKGRAGKEAPAVVGANGSTDRGSARKLVAIGSSAGGPAALATILAGLPADFAASVVVVQHLDEKFAPGMIEWLGEQTPLAVRLARPDEHPQPGVISVAGTSDHLTLTNAGAFRYTAHPLDNPYRPSVDAFFESAARWWRGDILGVLLTGMGRDGANGLKTLRARGCHTVAQDQATSAIYGMPRQAALIGAAVEILPLGHIAGVLKNFASGKTLCSDVVSGVQPSF